MTVPTFPITLIRQATGEPFRVDDMAELNTLASQGGWALAEPTPGVDLAVHSSLPRTSSRVGSSREGLTRRQPEAPPEPPPAPTPDATKQWPPPATSEDPHITKQARTPRRRSR